ncbi:MAG: TatD family hydrolase [bacterium]|nr:TatD family hydrolase [bacterium]
MSPFLIDAHSHINFSAYKDDAPEVIRRAEDGAVWMFVVGSQIDTSRRAVEYAEQYEHIWAVVGLHPIHLVDTFVDKHEVGEEQEGVAFRTRREVFDADAYRILAAHPKTVGIGECGMDFYHIPEGMNVATVQREQEDAFRAQIALARELGLPLVVHVRDGAPTPSHSPSQREGEDKSGDAHEETIRILGGAYDAWDGVRPRGLIHCYSGTWNQAERYLAMGFNISFTGVITFTPTKKQRPIQEELWRVVRNVPLDRFHVETDCPYLTPEPHRGGRNEPAYVRHVAEKVAELRACPLQDIARASVENTMRMFWKMQS